jgi:hypothetical protein
MISPVRERPSSMEDLRRLLEQEEWLAEKLGEGRQSGEQLSLQTAFSNSDKA